MIKKIIFILIIATGLLPGLNNNRLYAQTGEEFPSDPFAPYGETCLLFPELCNTEPPSYPGDSGTGGTSSGTLDPTTTPNVGSNASLLLGETIADSGDGTWSEEMNLFVNTSLDDSYGLWSDFYTATNGSGTLQQWQQYIIYVESVQNNNNTQPQTNDNGLVKDDGDPNDGSALLGQLPCHNSFILPFRTIIHFTPQQLARISTLYFDGGSLTSFRDINGNMFYNALAVKTSGSLATPDGNTYYFVSFDNITRNLGTLNQAIGTTIEPDDEQGTPVNVFKKIPYNDLNYCFSILADNVETAAAGKIVEAINSSGQLYCKPLSQEDCSFGTTSNRDDVYLKPLHLQHYTNLPGWCRAFLQQLFKGVVNNCSIDFVNNKLDALHNEPLYVNETDEDTKEIEENAALGYYMIFGALSCKTNEESVKGAQANTQYGMGVLHELINTVDLVSLGGSLINLAKGATNLVSTSVNNLFSTVKEVCIDAVSTSSIDYNNIANKWIASNIGNVLTVYDKVKSIASHFKTMYFTDCDNYTFLDGTQGDICNYRHGQVFMMALPIILTAGDWSVMKATALTANYAANTERAIALAEAAENSGGQVLDQLDNVMNTEKTVIEDAGGTVTSTIKKEDDIIVITEANDLIDETKLSNLAAEVPNSLFINSTKFKNSALKIDPEIDPTLKSIADDVIANGDLSGDKTEEIQNILFGNRAGFTTLDGKVGSNNGLDGLYIKGTVDNPTEIVVCESKQWNSGGGASVDGGNSGLPIQMSDAWIQNVAQRLINNGKADFGNMLLNNTGLITKYLIVVNKTTGDINVLKLGSY